MTKDKDVILPARIAKSNTRQNFFLLITNFAADNDENLFDEVKLLAADIEFNDVNITGA
uniref:Uncharacterized protein n=1 Tax=Romanomermis culicivorax TaxID=13658 RepID=A0A915K8Y9_ROMCU